MYMRPCCPSGGSNFGYGVAARHPIPHSDKILVVVCVQHFTAISSLNNDGVAVPALRPAFNHAPFGYSPDRCTHRRGDIGSGVISGFAVDRIPAPAPGRTDNSGDRQIRNVFATTFVATAFSSSGARRLV